MRKLILLSLLFLLTGCDSTEVFEKEFYFDDKRYLEKEIKKTSKLFNDNIIYNYGIEIYNSNKLIGKYNTLIEVKNYYEKKLMEIYG